MYLHRNSEYLKYLNYWGGWYGKLKTSLIIGDFYNWNFLKIAYFVSK